MPRRILFLCLLAAAATPVLAGCGGVSDDVKLPDKANEITSVAAQYREGAHIFVQRCSGCHTFGLVGAEGGALRVADPERNDGPNFNVRKETKDNVLYALHNGGFSGRWMPPNIVVGEQADKVAEFLEQYAGYGNVLDRTPSGNSRAAGKD